MINGLGVGILKTRGCYSKGLVAGVGRIALSDVLKGEGVGMG